MNDDRIRVRCVFCGEDWETWGTWSHADAVFTPEHADGLRCPECGAAAPLLVEVNGEEIEDIRAP